MTMLLAACSTDIDMEQTTMGNATVTERIPISLNASPIHVETSADTRAASDAFNSNIIAVWCLPVSELGTTSSTAIDMTSANIIPMANVQATLPTADSGSNTLIFTTNQSSDTENTTTNTYDYLYPEITTSGTNYRYAFFAYQPVAEEKQIEKTDSDVVITYSLDGTNNILWSSASNTDAYAYSEAYWQRTPNASSPELATFKHTMAAVTVKVTATDTDDTQAPKIASISLNNMPASGKLSLLNGTMTVAGTETTTYTYNVAETSTTAEATFYVIPTSDSLSITVNYQDSETNPSVTKTTTATALTAGTEYTINAN